MIASARGVDDDGQIEITESPEDGGVVVMVGGLSADQQTEVTATRGFLWSGR
ncbi:MAG: hypothetical protein Q4C85_07675 [Actinomyces sp.]|uniref:hypothetical protein n=1 Tax=Actinomyces sp. TaxID=29317 RepID=UPI0026DD0E81|nr:hypothetical protein [Actinomyces sp.]MDO4243622.1 hypothetical protein [Actinomyces sp.]